MRYLYKEKGETPLECIERHQLHRPYTYAGRLDPMAEGVLLVLEGEECKDRERYLSKDKTYEYECIVGIKTDTSDALGCITDTLVVSTPPPHTAVTQIKGDGNTSISYLFFKACRWCSALSICTQQQKSNTTNIYQKNILTYIHWLLYNERQRSSR